MTSQGEPQLEDEMEDDAEEVLIRPRKVDSSRTLSPGIKPLLVLAKIRGILDTFSLEKPTLALSEIRALTGFPTSTVQRLVANLVAEEFLDRDGDTFRIGVNFGYWAAPAMQGRDFIEAVLPVLRQLRDRTGETVALFRLERDFRVCVAVAETERAIRREMHVGKVLPLHAGSAGKVLLAWNPDALERVLATHLEPVTSSTLTDPAALRTAVEQARRDGFAVSHNERDEGASGLSAPVFDPMGELLGAINISGPTLRVTVEKCEEWVEPLARAAEQATRIVGGRLPF